MYFTRLADVNLLVSRRGVQPEEILAEVHLCGGIRCSNYEGLLGAATATEISGKDVNKRVYCGVVTNVM